jgi:hypothetical protein
MLNNTEHSSHNDQLYIKPTSNNLHINIKTDSPELIACVVYLYYSDNTSNVLINLNISNKEETYKKLSLTPK